MSYSVLMSVYSKDNAEYLKDSLNSIMNQKCPPGEIILIKDGPLSADLDAVIDDFKKKFDCIRIISFKINKGLGIALKEGLFECSYDLVARMDADDISEPDRFQKQIEFFKNNPNVDIIGGQITEFIDDPNNIVGRRTVPLTNSDIYKYLKLRCPFNHMTVMFKKQSVIKAGGYIDWHYNEDYYLWIRMALAGCKFANLPDTLVNVRVGKDMYSRRGGWKYFRSEQRLQRYMLDNQIISGGGYLANVLKRLIVQVLVPASVRGWIFRKFART